MKIFAKLAAIVAMFATITANAADLTTSGDGSVMLSVWQEGTIAPAAGTGTGPVSVLVDTGLNFSDLFNLGGGDSITVDVNSIFDVGDFLDSSIGVASASPQMNIVGGAQNGGFQQLFVSNENFIDSAINVELQNSIINTDLFLERIGATNVETSLSATDFPNAGAGNSWGDNFGTAFQDIDNAFELPGTPEVFQLPTGPFDLGPMADGNASGEMILFQTSTQGTLNGQPLQVNEFAGLFTFAYDLVTGELTFTNLGAAAAIPLPAAVWFLGSALIGLMGFSRRRAIAA